MSNVIGTDISFYNDDNSTPLQVDFQKMKSNGAKFVIIRTGQNTWVDPDFASNWQKAKEFGLARGSYWYYDSRVSPESQAELYVAQFKGDYGELPLFADFEESYGGIYKGVDNWIKFLNKIESLIPSTVELAIYTGPYYWMDNVPQSKKVLFEKYPLWIAHYGASSPMIPAPWAMGKWLFWQFTETGNGRAFGSETTNIDVNYFNGTEEDFNARFGLLTGSSNIKHITTRRFESDIHTVIVSKGTKTQIYYNGSRTTVLTMAKKTGAKIAVNGGDYNPYTGKPTGLLAVDGVIRSGFEQYMPWLNATATNEIQINTFDAKQTPYNAVAGRRMLVVNGKQSDKTSGAWLEVHPKTFFGVNASGDLIIITADGRTSKSRGVNLYEGAQLLIEAGAVQGFDGGGGGDTTLVIDGKVVNVPIADTTPGELRPVADGVLIFGTLTEIPEEEPNTGENMSTYIVRTSARFRSLPTTSTNDTGASSIVGDIFESTITQPDTKNPSTIMVKHPSNKWLPLKIGNIVYTELKTVIPPPEEEPEEPYPGFVLNINQTYEGCVIGTVILNGKKYKEDI